jgi:hypothetical protein
MGFNSAFKGLRRVRVTIIAVEKQYGITYSECMSVDLVIRHSNGMRHTYYIVICGVSDCTIFFHIIS